MAIHRGLLAAATLMKPLSWVLARMNSMHVRPAAVRAAAGGAAAGQQRHAGQGGDGRVRRNCPLAKTAVGVGCRQAI